MPIKIFISHASVDEPLASALVNCIFSSMVLEDNEVRCTSVPGHKLNVVDLREKSCYYLL
jgi:hypothetical protein